MKAKRVDWDAITTRADADEALVAAEAHLVAELRALNAEDAKRRERRQQIRDERYALEQERNAVYRRLRDPNAGPDQVIGV